MEIAIELIGYALAALAFTAFGLLVEFHGYLMLIGGETIPALWVAVVGSLFLYAGVYLLGYRRVLRGIGPTV